MHLNGNLFGAAKWINDKKLAQYLLNIEYMSSDTCVAIFRVESYPDYCNFCKKTKQEPMSTDDYFN